MQVQRLRFELRLDGTDLELESARLLSFVYFHTVRGCARYHITCMDPNWSYYDGLYRTGAELVLRFGVEREGKEFWSPEHKLSVGEIMASYHIEFVKVRLSGMDTGAAFYDKCSQKVFKGKKISEMVQDLAEASDLDTRIEETKDEFDMTQGMVPDGQFVRNVLLPKAYNETRQDYLCYVKDGDTLVFEPPDVQDVQATLNFPSTDTQFEPVDFLKVWYRPTWLAPNGSYSTQVRGVNPFEKEGLFFTADDDSVDYQKLADTGPSAPDSPSRIVPIGEVEDKVVENIGKALWSTKCRELWIVDAKTTLSPQLEVGRAVDLQMTSASGKSHFASGKYLLVGVIHWIDLAAQLHYSRLWLARRTR